MGEMLRKDESAAESNECAQKIAKNIFVVFSVEGNVQIVKF